MKQPLYGQAYQHESYKYASLRAMRVTVRAKRAMVRSSHASHEERKKKTK